MPWRDRRPRRVTVTWTSPSSRRPKPQIAAADWWLSAAPSPHREHGRHLAPVQRGDRAHLVDAAVQRYEPAGVDTPRDGSPADPRGRRAARSSRRRAGVRRAPRSPGQAVHFAPSARPRLAGEVTHLCGALLTIGGPARELSRNAPSRARPEHPTATPGPTPSMPQFKRRRHRFATKRRASYAAATAIPVDDVPPRVDVVRALVLVLEVVRVLPDVDAEQRRRARRDRVVLVGGADDREPASRRGRARPSRSRTG